MSIPQAEYAVGVTLCEENAYDCSHKAGEFFIKGEMRVAFFYGALALEEIGKAHYILEKWEQPNITRAEWQDFDTIRSHVGKILKAGEAFKEDTQKIIDEMFPKLGAKVGLMGWSEEELRQIFDIRNRVLFVDYVFPGWSNPRDVPDIYDKAMQVIDKSRSAFTTLEKQMHDRGLDTIYFSGPRSRVHSARAYALTFYRS